MDKGEPGNKRYRLFFKMPISQNSQTQHDTCWRQHVNVTFADSHEDAIGYVLEHGAYGDGRWLSLCETDGTYEQFTVKKHTSWDVTRVDQVVAA